MKNFLLVTCFFICLSACKKPKDIDTVTVSEPCVGVDSILPPDAFNLIERANLSLDMSLKQVQFVTENTGYVLTTINEGGYVGMLKTEDKGLSWSDLKIKTPVYPRSMYFKNEKEGFITVQDTRSCPANCGNKSVILKTIDGGLNWTEIQYPNISGVLHHLKFDNSGHAFAVLANYNSNKYSVIKSTDNCATWTVISDDPNIRLQYIYFSYAMSTNHLYLLGKNGTLIKINKNGALIEVLTTGQVNINNLKVVSDSTLIAEIEKGLIKSIDGGKTWKTLTSQYTRIIDFPSENEGLILLNKSYCEGDVYRSNDVFAYTKDGGLSWQEGKQCANLMLHYQNAQTDFNNDKYLFLIGKKIIEFKKK